MKRDRFAGIRRPCAPRRAAVFVAESESELSTTVEKPENARCARIPAALIARVLSEPPAKPIYGALGSLRFTSASNATPSIDELRAQLDLLLASAPTPTRN